MLFTRTHELLPWLPWLPLGPAWLPGKEMSSSIDDLLCFRQTRHRIGRCNCTATPNCKVLPVVVCECVRGHAWHAVPGGPGWAVWNEGVLGVLLTCQALMQPSGGGPRWPGRPVTSDERGPVALVP